MNDEKAPRLILASKSASRRAMLAAAGVRYESIPADIDERGVEAGLADAGPVVGHGDIAEALSVAKAAAVAALYPGALVLGSDSLVVVGGRRFDKPRSIAEAGEHLRFFSDQVIELHSAAALVRDGGCEWSHASIARLHVRALSDEFITHYLHLEWPAISHTVGAFRIEGPGVQLFESIEGDQFTVLGMPLLPLLGALREAGVLLA